MELRKRKAPPAPVAPPPKRTSSKKAGTAVKKGAESIPADGAAVLDGPGPVAGLGAAATGEQPLEPATETGAQESAPTVSAQSSELAGAADADIAAVSGAATDAAGPSESTLSSGGAGAAGASTVPPATTVGMTEPQADGASTAPAPQTLADSNGAAAPAEDNTADTGDATVVTETDGAGGASIPQIQDEPKDSTSKSGPPGQGDRVDVASFGGTMQLEDGTTTNLAEMLSKSRKGVIFFTYPKASTPGCTKQACLFRDHHTTFTTPDPSTGYGVYGLSRDSPKSNTTFRQKQNLPYNLICDIEGTLLKALGLAKAPKSAIRAVVVISGEGKILARVEGGPDATVQAARDLVEKVEGEGKGVQQAAVEL